MKFVLLCAVRFLILILILTLFSQDTSVEITACEAYSLIREHHEFKQLCGTSQQAQVNEVKCQVWTVGSLEFLFTLHIFHIISTLHVAFANGGAPNV